MKDQTSVRLLLGAAIAAPLLAFWPKTQDPSSDEWARHVDKACTASRFGIRVAAARKVASGGDLAVPAVRAWEGEHGRNAIPSSLVDAIADEHADGPEVRGLLKEWARDADFYWRSAAMRGLALGQDEALRPLFESYADDPSWLTRVHARLGLHLLDPERAIAPDPDPRAAVRLTRLLLENDRTPPLQPLLDALVDERTFLGVPWGARLGQEANQALRRWLGDDYPDPNPDDKAGSVARLRETAEKKSGQSLAQPEPRSDQVDGIVGGIEILSCKNGDQFVQWDADGNLHFGIDGSHSAPPPTPARTELLQKPTPLALDGDLGVVVCDSMRVRLDASGTHVKVAPESLPTNATSWLQQLADKLEEQGADALAADLRKGVEQFATR